MTESHQRIADAQAFVATLDVQVRHVDNLEDRALREFCRHNQVARTWADFPPRTKNRIVVDYARHNLTNYDALVPLCRSQLEIDLLRGRVGAMVRATHPEVFA